MYRSTITSFAIVALIATMTFAATKQADCQVFDQLFRNVRASPAEQEQPTNQIGVTRDRQTGTMGVRIP